MKRSKPIQANPRRRCDTCNGRGTVPIDHHDRRQGDKACPNCNGKGSC